MCGWMVCSQYDTHMVITRMDKIELAESEVARLIEVARKQGLNSWELLDIFLRACVDLHIQASCEYRLHHS